MVTLSLTDKELAILAEAMQLMASTPGTTLNEDFIHLYCEIENLQYLMSRIDD